MSFIEYREVRKMSDPSPNVNISLVSFTDLVKALREALGLAGDVQKIVASTSQAYQRFKDRKAARQLGALSFPPDETRQYLGRIANGEGTPEDFEAIRRRLSETGGEIESCIAGLDKYSDVIREKFGLEVAHKWTDLIHGYDGKASIRFALEMFAEQGDESFYDAAAVAKEAGWILESIDSLNHRLVEMHDMVLGLGEK